MNCRACRDAMCTDELLSQLRCAECSQIEFEHFCSLALKAGLLLSVGFLAVRMLTLNADPATQRDSALDPDRYAA